MKRISWSRLTIRARLTLVYGGLFLLAGMVMLALTYALVSSASRGEGTRTTTSQPAPSPGQSEAPPTSASAPAGQQSTGSGNLVVTQIRDDTWHDALNALLTQGAIALAVVGAASVALGWLIAGRLLQPLQHVTDTARRIADAPAADRGLHERIELDGPPDEIKNLADTFNRMLERLDHSFDGQRRFIANASHELRTPLTVNRSLLELALYRTATTPELRQLGETLLEMNSRQEKLLDGLLLLARSEREVTDRSYLDLADVVDHVVARVPADKVTVRAEPGEAPTTGNPALLERLVQNLVDNGVRHNIPDDGWVLVTTATRPDGTVAVQVSNTGPVIPPYDIPSLFEPFVRRGPDRVAGATPGAGLGLSIVQAVARAHGGDVQAEPRDGGGLILTVTLPAAT